MKQSPIDKCIRIFSPLIFTDSFHVDVFHGIDTGCLSEEGLFDYGFKKGISLESYLTKGEFFGRSWLFQKLNNDLLNNRTNSRGVLLLAEMGYGKTAIITQCICATPDTVGFKLRQHLVAYHVCRFNVPLTKTSDSFVKRLALMLSNRFPEFSNQVRAQNTCVDIFNTQTCNEYPYGCFDQCVLNPFRNIQKFSLAIVVVDAIDECEDDTQQNAVLDLLKHMIFSFPRSFQFQFLVTARYSSKYLELEDYLNITNLQNKDNLNKQDITAYLEMKFPNQKQSSAKSVPNFLIASELMASDNFENSQTMKMYYDQKFSRFFKDNFHTAKLVLEIICTCSEQLTEDMLWQVLSLTTRVHEDDFNLSFDKLKDFFIVTRDGRINLYHESLYIWLIDTKGKFRISQQHGHQLWAEFLIYEYGSNITNREVELAVHIAKTSSVTKTHLGHAFISLPRNQDLQLKWFPFHKLLQHTDLPEALQLLMLFHHDTSIDQMDESGKTPLFIAAAFGRVKSFKFLLDKGADMNIVVEPYSKLINFINASRESFENRHWQYTPLDIAVQNGHLSIVELILERQKSFVSSSQNLGLNMMSIHLACKVGHVNIVKLLSENSKKLDFLCLYYAAENEKKELVKYLLSEQIEDSCRPCNETFYWLPVNTSRIQGKKVLPTRDFDPKTYVLYDDWNMITCESALHVAVRMNHLGIVDLLLSQKKHASDCYDRGGRTPLAAAIQYDFQDISKRILNQIGYNGNSQCISIPELKDKEQLNDYEITSLQSIWCQNGSTVLHVAAKFDRLWLIEHLESLGISLNWTVKNSYGCTALHTAACSNSMGILTHKKGSKLLTQTCTNSSSLLHSAVVCLSYQAVEFLLSTYPNKVDEELLSLVRLTSLNASIPSEMKTTYTSEITIFKTLLKHGANIFHVDKNGRNILHYAILNGHFYIADTIFKGYPTKAFKLLKQTDAVGNTPVVNAVQEIQNKTSCMVSVDTFDPVHSVSQRLTEITVLLPKELSIFFTLSFMDKNHLLEEEQLTSLQIKMAERQSCELLMLTNRYIRKDFSLQKNKELISVIARSGFSSLVLYDFLNTMSQKIPKRKLLDNIKNNIKVLPLIVRSLDVYPLKVFNLKPLFKNILSDLSPDVFTNSFDDFGYNIYESAVLNGNYILLEIFHGYGIKSRHSLQTQVKFAQKKIKMQFYVKVKFNKVLFSLIKTNEVYDAMLDPNLSVQTKEEMFIRHLQIATGNFGYYLYMQENNTDITIANLLKHHRQSIQFSFICCSKCFNFSLVHIAAAKGYFETFTYIANEWGARALNCPNGDSFVPMYLAKMFSRKYIESLMQQHGLDLIMPKPSAEYALIFKLQSRFSLSNKKFDYLKCMWNLRYSLTYNLRNMYRAVVCNKLVNHWNGGKTMFKKVKSLKWFWVFIKQYLYLIHLYSSHPKYKQNTNLASYLLLDKSYLDKIKAVCRSTWQAFKRLNSGRNLGEFLHKHTSSKDLESGEADGKSGNVFLLHCMRMFLVEERRLNYMIRVSNSKRCIFRDFQQTVLNLVLFASKYRVTNFVVDISLRLNITEYVTGTWLLNLQLYRYMDIIQEVDVYQNFYLWNEGELETQKTFIESHITLFKFMTWNKNAYNFKNKN